MNLSKGCAHRKRRKHGRSKAGTQRFRCCHCGKTFTESTRILSGMRIGLDKAEIIVRCLVEGMSINSVSRIVSIDPHTICDLIVVLGKQCRRYLEKTIKDIHVDDVQADEIWSFVYCKERTRVAKKYDSFTGDCYCWTAIESNTRLFLAWHLGKRDDMACSLFIYKLDSAIHPGCKFQMSTDGLGLYAWNIKRHFGYRVNYGRIVKKFGIEDNDDRKYSPAGLQSLQLEEVYGKPEVEKISTSYIERSNLTLRMHIRRFTRLTNGFSKKWLNHSYSVALFVAYYNFCKTHLSLKTAPAVATGITSKIWAIRDLIVKTCNT